MLASGTVVEVQQARVANSGSGTKCPSMDGEREEERARAGVEEGVEHGSSLHNGWLQTSGDDRKVKRMCPPIPPYRESPSTTLRMKNTNRLA